MMEAVRQYKANLSIVEMAKKASQEALNMTKNG
jgi:flagellar basal body rod protein FlgC